MMLLLIRNLETMTIRSVILLANFRVRYLTGGHVVQSGIDNMTAEPVWSYRVLAMAKDSAILS